MVSFLPLRQLLPLLESPSGLGENDKDLVFLRCNAEEPPTPLEEDEWAMVT